MPTIKNDFDDLIYAASESYDAPFSWIKAIIGAESEFNPNAYRAEPQINDASRGLMQILYKTAQGLGYKGTPEGLFDPATNINLGAKFIAGLRDQFGEDFKAVYSAYNSGSGKAYLTNTTVAAHVNRAVSYLNTVEANTAEVTADAGDGSSEAGIIDASGIGIIIALAGAVAYFLTRKG